MELVVVVGEDEGTSQRARREALARSGAAPADVERIDVATDKGAALLAAVGSPSMFSPRRVVDCWNLHEIDPSLLAALREAATTSDAFVVARAPKLPVATRRKLPEHTLVTASAPAARDLPSALREHGARLGVRLSPAQASLLASRCRERPDRAWSVVDQLALVKLSRPLDRQVETLLGSTWPTPTPWEVAERAESGPLSDALDMWHRAGDDTAFGLVGYLRKSLTELSLARTADAAAVAAATGVAPSRAAQLVRRARRVDPADLEQALRAVCRCEDELRSSSVRAASVDLALVHYARCFSATATASRPS